MSYKRAELRQQAREREKEDKKRRNKSVISLASLGISKQTADSILRGLELAVDEETERRQEAIIKAVMQTLVEAESQICVANILAAVKAVDMTLGKLKTTQKSWDKFFENYCIAVQEVEDHGQQVCDEVSTKLDCEFILDEVDFEQAELDWKSVRLAANTLKSTVEKYVSLEGLE